MIGLLKRIARRLLPRGRVGTPAGPRNPGLAAPTLAGQLRQVGLAFADWHDRRRHQRRLYGRPAAESLAWLRCHLPTEVAATRATADKLLQHRFDLLGSGPFQPRDPERPVRTDGYQPIDWYLDPVKGLRFPRGVPHQKWDLLKMRPGLADVKLPWELARCQHFVPLAQTYLLSGEGRYACEIACQVEDFCEANPVGVGINWTCTMDVALRALNWALALEMIANAPGLSEAFWQRAHESLFAHGAFIFATLENQYEVTSNHFLSNLIGLHYLAAVFADLPEGQAWKRFSREGLETENRVQVLNDGADYESSVPYHRLVTELFLGAARLAEHHGEPFSEAYRARLGQMVAFHAAVLRPDGRMPQIGDADDGRLHVFTAYGRLEPQDGRHLLASAGPFFGRPDWTRLAGPTGAWEAAWWGYDPPETPAAAGPLPPETRLFPDAGLVVVREPRCYLLIANSVVGTRGFGNHKHNDQLGFEFHLDGVPLLVDPGSYVYTSDPEARNRFRGTAYHNTLCIDGVEQNEMCHEWLFRLFENARAEHLTFRVREDAVEYRGRHVGYRRLRDSVTHERHFQLRPGQQQLLIADHLSGTGQHTFDWHFHLAPGVQATTTAAGIVHLQAANRCYRLQLPADLVVRINPAWYSPSYGVRVPCQAIDAGKDFHLKGQAVFRFAIGPDDDPDRVRR